MPSQTSLGVFFIAAWASCMSESSVQLLERVQSRCLRTVLGAKAHAAADAVDTITKCLAIQTAYTADLCIGIRQNYTEITKQQNKSDYR